ncbi:hypothetical protein ACET3Z_000107 [Daucus carota]
MKSVGRTCLLSKRWTRLWTYLKHLDFGEPETLNYTMYAQSKMDKFVERVNRVIIANQAPYLDAFRIKFPLNSFYAAHIQSWLKFAFDKQVCNLDLDFLDICYPPIHFSNIFSTDPALILNTTLTSFYLKSVTINGPFLQWLLTNCTNLQHLLFHRCKASSDDDTASSMHHRRLVVSSPQLRHLEFYHSLKSLNIQVLCLSAPNLSSFVIYESKYEVEYRSVPSLVDATFGWLYCHHLFKNQDSISSFSFQLEKLSIWWHMEHTVYSQFPNFANVQQLEIISKFGHGDLILTTSLIEACPLLHTFKLKMMCSYKLESTRQISAPDYAQENAIRCHQHLKVVEYLGYEGCASAAGLAVCLARHAPMLQREEDVKVEANKYSERQLLGTSAQADKDYKEPPPPLFEPGELTSWSFYQAGTAEFIATLLFFMIFALVYCTAGISGGHINLAVTFGLFLARKLSLTRALFYIVMQCLGAICGAGVIKGFEGSSRFEVNGDGEKANPRVNTYQVELHITKIVEKG